MKNKAAGFLKRIMSALASMAKAKTLALKSKTSALRTRLIIFSLLKDKKLMMSSITHKLHALTCQHQHKKEDDDAAGNCQSNKALVLYNRNFMSLPIPTRADSVDSDHDSVGYFYEEENDDGDNKYPDLTHSLFDSEDLDFEDPGGSVIDLVKNSKQEGEEFRLEEEIDHVADLFIKRFHKQMRLQKQLSIKRYQEMLERSA